MLSHFSHVHLFATLCTVTHQAPLSMGFSRQEYWGGLPFPSPGDLPDPGLKLPSLNSPTLAGRFFTTSATWKAITVTCKATRDLELPTLERFLPLLFLQLPSSALALDFWSFPGHIQFLPLKGLSHIVLLGCLQVAGSLPFWLCFQCHHFREDFSNLPAKVAEF